MNKSWEEILLLQQWIGWKGLCIAAHVSTGQILGHFWLRVVWIIKPNTIIYYLLAWCFCVFDVEWFTTQNSFGSVIASDVMKFIPTFPRQVVALPNQIQIFDIFFIL